MEGREARGGEAKGRLRLFGVTICGGGAAEEWEGGEVTAEEVMRKSKSMGNLESAATDSSAAERGYLSDGGLRNCKRRRRRAGAAGQDRKKGEPWTEEEHRTFLEGLEKLGKGNWRGISRKFVLTRTPTQVASHAQKYFLRQTIPTNKKRRSSLFDVVINDSASISETLPMASLNRTQNGSKEINLLRRGNEKVGTPDLNSGPASSLLPEELPYSEPRSFHTMYLRFEQEGLSGFMGAKRMSVQPQVSQTLSFMPDAPQPAMSSKMHANQTTFCREFKLLPRCPAQANILHQVAEGSDLELSIAPPAPLSLSKAPPQNGVGMIRVV